MSFLVSSLLFALMATATPIQPRATDNSTATSSTSSGLEAHTVSGGYYAFGTAANSFVSNLSNIVVFGDSLSDDGSGARVLSGGTTPPPAGYPTGRYSDGPVHPEYLATRLGLNLTGFAVGGATTFENGHSPNVTNPTTNITSIVPPTLTQLDTYLGNVSTSIESTLHIIWTGGNDLLQASSTGHDTALAVQGGVDKLINQGAKHILLMNLFNLTYSNYTAELFDSYNSIFGSASNYSPVVAITDTYTGAVYRSADYAEQFGFDPALLDTACMPRTKYANGTTNYTRCADASSYEGWDGTHPTTRVHSLIASMNVATLLRKGWAANA